jgi:hypothetical protein
MSLADLLTQHLALCDELHHLCLEENQILKNDGHPPDAAWRERKRALADRLDHSLIGLRARPAVSGERGGELLEQARMRCLQILHLDRQNEQLLLRCSLGPARPAPQPMPALGALRAYGKVGPA